jgi:hypothetical protein
VVEEAASGDPEPAEELIALEDDAELGMLVEEVPVCWPSSSRWS